jgi:hypothetical protein
MGVGCSAGILPAVPRASPRGVCQCGHLGGAALPALRFEDFLSMSALAAEVPPRLKPVLFGHLFAALKRRATQNHFAASPRHCCSRTASIA